MFVQFLAELLNKISRGKFKTIPAESSYKIPEEIHGGIAGTKGKYGA